ncbi:unnamed protein product [Gongylonema pulchrum]|uniref:DUF4123 domain-containing protein n=1 Tax=Gongylonema pulchrum TaxID=637853 RepID=A0A183EH48_9BILA|nr:unnamed protein product [Gongylonema pulchrum]
MYLPPSQLWLGVYFRLSQEFTEFLAWISSEGREADVFIQHIPGYLTLQCQNDDILGITLILQWLPNAALEKNPAR